MADQDNLDFQLKIQAALDASQAANSLKDLKKSMRELTGLAEEVGIDNVDAYTKIKEAAGKAADKIGDMNASTRALAGTPLENTTKSLGLIKDNLMSLDFEELNKNVTLFSSSLGKLNPSFLSDGFKTLGTTLIELGKTLLTNPIFLIGAAIAFIIAKFDDLKGAGGLVGKVFTAIGDIIGGVIKIITAFTDAIGLTDIAAQKATEKKLKYLEQEKDAISERYATEEKAAEATHQNVGVIQLKQYQAELDNAKATIAIYEGIKKEKGKLSDDETAKYQDALKDFKKIQDEAYLYVVENAQKIYDAEKESVKNIKQARIDNVRDETAKKKQQADLDFENSKVEIKKTITERTQQLETARKAELQGVSMDSSTYYEIQGRYSKLYTKLNQEATDQITAANDKKNLVIRQANEENAVKEKTRLLNNASEEVKLNQDKYNLIENNLKLSDEQKYNLEKQSLDERKALLSDEYLANVALIDKQIKYAVKGSEEQKQLIADKKKVQSEFYITLANLEQQSAKLSNDYTLDTKTKYLEGIIQKETAIKNFSTNLKKQLDADIAIVKAQAEEQLLNDRLTADQRKQIVNRTDLEIEALQKAYSKRVQRILLDAQLQGAQLELANLQKQGSLRLGYENRLITQIASLRKKQLSAQETDELKTVEKGSAQETAIRKKYAQQQKAIDSDTQKARLQNFAATSQQILGVASAAANVLSGLNDLITQNENQNLKKGEKASVEVQKKQFNRQKALNIVGAVINTAQGVTQALSSSPPPYSFIMAALVGALGAIQIAKIASTKFNPESSSDSSAGSGSVTTPTGPSITAPSLNSNTPSPQAGQFFSLGTAQHAQKGGTTIIQPVLVVDDVTKAQNKVSSIRARATL